MSSALWAILASLYPTKTKQEITADYKKLIDSLCIDGDDFKDGLRTENIHMLEAQNRLKINVITFKVEGSTGSPKILLFSILHNNRRPQRLTNQFTKVQQ